MREISIEELKRIEFDILVFIDDVCRANGLEVIPFVIALAATWAVARLINRLLCHLGLHVYLAMILSMAVFGLTILALFFKKIFAVLKKINSFKL